MRINTNRWNRIRYSLYTPAYDALARIFETSRKRSIESLDVQIGDKVLIIGAGTGLDLEFLPDHCEIVATDLTPAMVRRIDQRSRLLNKKIKAVVMDGQALDLEAEQFDKVILHLILAVIPDPFACIRETTRVLKQGGTVVVFDKFVPTGQKVSFRRKLISFFSNLIATDLTRSAEIIFANSGLSVISDEPANWNGNFRLIKLRKE